MLRSHIVRFAGVAVVLIGCGGGSGGGGSGGSGGAGGKGIGGAATGGHAGGAGGAAGAATGGSTGGAAGGQATGGTAAGGSGGGGVGGAATGGTAGAFGGNGGTAGSGGHAGAAGGASGGAGGAVACNNLVNGASVVNKDHDPAAPPAMTGGTIVSGTYHLTKMVQYNGENGNTPHQETWVLSNGAFQAINKDGARYSGTYSTSGTNLIVSVTCPATQTVTMPYTATATQIVTINQDDPNEAHTMTLQTGNGAGGAGGTAGACTNLSATGSAVSETMGSGSAATPAGGSIATGTYVLTGWTVYSPATAVTTQSRKLTLRLTSNTVELAGVDANGAALNVAGSWSASGTMVTTNWTCGTTGSEAQGYTASNNQLLIFDQRSGGIALETWTLQ